MTEFKKIGVNTMSQRGLKEYGALGVVFSIFGAGAGAVGGGMWLASMATTTLAAVGLGAVGLVAGGAIGVGLGALATVGVMAADDGIANVKYKVQGLRKKFDSWFQKRFKKSGAAPSQDATAATSDVKNDSTLTEQSADTAFNSESAPQATNDNTDDVKPAQAKKKKPGSAPNA